MYSGVFGVAPARTAEIMLRYLRQEIGLASVEVLDLDEEKYRHDEWAVRLYMSAKSPFEPTYVQAAKALIVGADEEAVKEVEKDLAEQQILALLARHSERSLVLSPIGAQGFVLGRGNQPLSPAVIRQIGPENIILIATPAKLARTPLLRFDTGDPALDVQLTARKFFDVIIGYRRTRLVKTAS
jgi:predicted polyphosphate/ATP-dependent NAD kinase